MRCILKSCTKCCGDLVLEDGDWRCIQCARYYYVPPIGAIGGVSLLTSYAAALIGADPVLAGNVGIPDAIDADEGAGRRVRGTRSLRNVNSMIQAKDVGEERWRSRNKEIIEYLDQGLSVREIEALVNRGQRHIRTVRERLEDLRTTA